MFWLTPKTRGRNLIFPKYLLYWYSIQNKTDIIIQYQGSCTTRYASTSNDLLSQNTLAAPPAPPPSQPRLALDSALQRGSGWPTSRGGGSIQQMLLHVGLTRKRAEERHKRMIRLVYLEWIQQRAFKLFRFPSPTWPHGSLGAEYGHNLSLLAVKAAL